MKGRVKVRGRAKLFCIATVATLTLPAAAQAQWYDVHPGYGHAMSDLRTAYWLIQHRAPSDPVQSSEEGDAMGAIRAAYGDLQQASIRDNKNIDDLPPANYGWGNHRGRLHQAESLLHRAHDEIAKEEDNPAARGLRNRAIHDIDNAGRATDAAIQHWGF